MTGDADSARHPTSAPARRCVSAAVNRLRTFGVVACNRVSHGAHGNVHLPAYHIPRAQPAHHWRNASDPRRPSSGARGVEDAAPYGGCVWVGVSIKPPLSVRRGRVSRSRLAWPIAPAFDTVRQVTSTAPRMQFRGHSPRTIFYRRPMSSFTPRRAGVEDKPLRRECEGVRAKPAV